MLLSSGGGLAVVPGGVFVVGGLVCEAAVEDPDETVGEGSEGSVVGVANPAAVVVEDAGTGAGADGGECPEVAGLTANTRYPAATNAPTNRPRSVSLATVTRAGSST